MNEKRNMFEKAVASSAFPLAMSLGLGAMFLAIEAGWCLTNVSLGVGFAAFLAGLGLERLIPASTASREPGELPSDIASALVLVGGLEPLLGALTPILVAQLLLPWMPTWLNIFQGPLWLNVVMAIVIAEFGLYWAHRASHEVEALWRLHAVHHSPHRLDVLNSFRIHPFNHILNHALSILPLMWLGANEEVLMVYAAFHAIGAIFQHVNADLEHGWLNGIFSTNVVHRWHHSALEPEGNSNYGSVLILWDRLFGTYRAADTERDFVYGLYSEVGYPLHQYFKELIWPFFGPGCCSSRPAN